MSRVLKFRAWDNAKKEWTLNIMECVSSRTGDIWMEPALKSHKVLIEQYTGLKDKNGKEIYEGDIVKTTDRVTAKGLIFPVGVVEFKQQAFWICNVPSERPDFTHNETLLQYWETDLVVIGNIHENPELLEGK